MPSSNNSFNTAPPTSSSPLSSPMVPSKKHAARTYGSKRAEVQLIEESPDADRSFGTLVDGDVSISLSPARHSRGTDDNVVSSQGTKVDEDNEGEDDSSKQRKHKWSWETELNELSDSDEEGESAPTLPIPHAAGSLSPSTSRDRSAKSKGKRPSASPKKTQHFPLTIVRSDSRASGRASADPEVCGSDSDCSPSPPKKRRASRRTADATVIEDSDLEASRASSSKSRGISLNSADMDADDHPPPHSTKRKRKTATGRKPTAKVNRYYIRSINFH